ncbi:unnamed protein product [Dracunculus medinensis]|uniref:EGF-like domain-containing protein n=1 Tax=Dracunculus medinensis TaxID=318479 RepID=A0A0N4UI01_DRAME|nr:unnamed protein product [Dracunculus medinensis]
MDGYSGILCESICDRSCKNAGQCVIENGISRCICPKGLGYVGEECEDEIIDCTTQGCDPGERCVQNAKGSPICIIDPCSTNPCVNKAICSPTYLKSNSETAEASFTCNCTVGFSGKLCENDIDECESNPCLNAGICKNAVGSFSCICLNGFSGIFKLLRFLSVVDLLSLVVYSSYLHSTLLFFFFF